MRAALSAFVGLAVVLALGATGRAAAKEVTLTGKLTCAKCDLGETKTCHTVIVVTKDGKDVVYYLDDKSAKANHKPICQGAKEGTVKGTLSEKDGKHWIKATKVTFNE
ncbi:MAG TPA: DUF6370 family protein [Gemmataceae bacterium]|nr:DUF6370 family protein [Gemmataceae bacterium]